MSKNIRSVKDLDSLISYLSENLGWNIDLNDFDDIDDITYDFDADDLGLKEEAFARISSLKQLRPLVDNQKWGIFLVDFDSRKFEVTALRKILSGLIPTRRNSSEHAVWDKHNLLFLCTWGDHNHTTIGAAHFEDSEKGLPQIKMISCEPGVEDDTQIRVFERRLEKLKWPDNPEDQEKWESDWSSAFRTSYRQTIKDSQTLVNNLSEEARNIRDRILQTLEVETEKGYVHKLFKEFKNKLIHDMSDQQFADMYAQTIVYGLFSARCMGESDNFDISHAVDAIPNTNPFLKGLMQECLGTKGSTNKLKFDELEVSSIIDLLMNTQTETIVEDFNRQTGGGREDPVIHFYEEFLTEYDKSQKVQRGVFYTPQPIVNFMVRAVDDLLKSEFGIEDGLASTSTKKIKFIRDSKKKRNGVYTDVEDLKEVPAIQVLDPGTGTGTFLRQIILQIYENFKKKHSNLSSEQLKILWNKYVEQHLLPRLNGFELMMAPYAVAHMKLAMVLKDTGYDFNNDQRLQVYLTNTLEEPGEDQITLFSDPLAIESMNANEAKKNTGINVIIGNPPYSVNSSNTGEWISNLLQIYKTEPGGFEKLHERNPKSINDDYVRFIRYGQTFVDNTSKAILAYVCPHGFIANPTFRGVRWQLLQAFNKLYLIDLHGNSNRQEICPDGSKDENVFDIQQGVCIAIFVKNGNRKSGSQLFHTDIYGLRDFKYGVLNSKKISELEFTEVKTEAPFYYFKAVDDELKKIYQAGISLTSLFPVSAVGITTAHDDFVIDKDPNVLLERFSRFKKEKCDAKHLHSKFSVKEKAGWDITAGWKNLQNIDDLSNLIKPIAYRPFDNRYIFYEDKLVWRTVKKFMYHMLDGNIGLVTARSNKGTDSTQFFISDRMTEYKLGERTTNSAVFPLFQYVNSFGKVEKKVNFNPGDINRIENIVQEPFNWDSRDEHAADFEIFNCFAVFDYIYAYVYSLNYRKKFHELINMDFPIIPLPKSKLEFFSLSKIGKRIRELHLMKTDVPLASVFRGNGSNQISKIKYDNGKLFINRTQYFDSVSLSDWEFKIGGYPTIQKCIKDRKGEVLNEKEINYISKIISIVKITQELMQEVDSVLQE